MKDKKFFKNCLKCGKIQGYTSKKEWSAATRKNLICSSCNMIEIQSRPEVKKKLINYRKEKYKGNGNPFFGKHHSKETIEKIKSQDYSHTQTKEFREKSARKGKQNGMWGRSFYDVWLQKYGKEEADKKLLLHKEKQSKNSSGSRNPMYGKLSPIGSGNGWSGWYKGWYFRSIKELSYMIYVIEKNNYKWSNGEKISIKYINFDGKERTYRPDFVIENKYLIEVKPKKMMDTPQNRIKKVAAIEFCEKNGLEYRMVDVKNLDIKETISLYKSGKITFVNKYKNRMEDMICKLEMKKKLQ